MASKQPNEQEIQFRKRARRRLIGAIALVLLMVTVLPMVLDDREAESPLPEIAISIPGQNEGDFTSRVIPEAPVAVPEEQAQPAVADQQRDAPEQAPAPQDEPPAVSQPEPAPAAPASTEKQSATPQHYVVQIGVYSDQGNVKKLQDKLAADGLKTYTQNITTESGSKVRLRMGPFDSRSDADKALSALKAAGMQGIVVSE